MVTSKAGPPGACLNSGKVAALCAPQQWGTSACRLAVLDQAEPAKRLLAVQSRLTMLRLSISGDAALQEGSLRPPWHLPSRHSVGTGAKRVCADQLRFNSSNSLGGRLSFQRGIARL